MSECRTLSALEAACYPVRSEGFHTGSGKHASVSCVINYPAADPSPSARLGMTAH
jgi:hypothetical protein